MPKMSNPVFIKAKPGRVQDTAHDDRLGRTAAVDYALTAPKTGQDFGWGKGLYIRTGRDRALIE